MSDSNRHLPAIQEATSGTAFRMDERNCIYVAGGETLMGTALIRQLEKRGYSRVCGGTGGGPELTDALAIETFFKKARPEFVFLVGGKSGGILANQRYPAELMRHNLLAECHIIHQAYISGVKKLLYLASSCTYPRRCPQPMHPSALLTGTLEPTNEAYAVAKLAGIKLCEAYRYQFGVPYVTAIPANPFGPGDDFHPRDSHVIAALLRRMHEAKECDQDHVVVWGSGNPRREFIYADDLADACLFAMQNYDDLMPINLGGGADLSIRELALMIRDVVGYCGEVRFDPTKPDGMPAKVLDSSKLLAMGWQPRTPFRAALAVTYEWFQQQVSQALPHFPGRN